MSGGFTLSSFSLFLFFPPVVFFFFIFLLTKQSKSVKMKHVRSGSKEAAAEEMLINVMWSDVREASSTFKLLLHITYIIFWYIGKKPRTSELLMRR